MNENNYRDITENVLPRVGFPDRLLDEQILSSMKNNPQSFIVKAADLIGQDQIQYDVRFAKNEKKPEDSNYYLNTITPTMTTADGEVRKHEFTYFFANGYTIQQINNIMDGRSVYNEFPKKDAPGEVHRMWFAIDLNNKDDKGMNLRNPSFENNTNFNLIIEAGKVPIVNQSLDEKNRMLYELRNGNEYLANIKMPDGSIQRGAVVALPHINQVAAYDMNGERIKFAKTTMQAVPLEQKENKTVNKSTAAVLATETKPTGTGQRKNTGS